MIYVLIFLGALLVNLYIILWGKGDLEKLKSKVSLRAYMKELEIAMDEMIGDKGTTALKIVFILLCIVIVLMNATFFFLSLLAFILGTYVAKKSYQIPIVSNILNKIATYINRLR